MILKFGKGTHVPFSIEHRMKADMVKMNSKFFRQHV